MAIRALLFDLDNTLWYFPVAVTEDALHHRCAEQIAPLLTRWGAHTDAQALSRAIGAEAELMSRTAAAGSLLSPDFPDAVDRVVRQAGLTLEPEQVEEIWRAWNVDGARLGRQLYPDTLTTLAWARGAGYRLGLISNRWCGRPLLEPELAAAGLGGLFDAITISCDVGWLKPHPEVFYAALHALGCEPEEAVAVGDSPRTDVTGAKLLGIRAALKRNGRRDQQPVEGGIEPDAVIDDLWELRRIPWLARGAAVVGGSGEVTRLQP
jgi:putative hydrolase of the HAD superfamily